MLKKLSRTSRNQCSDSVNKSSLIKSQSSGQSKFNFFQGGLLKNDYTFESYPCSQRGAWIYENDLLHLSNEACYVSRWKLGSSPNEKYPFNYQCSPILNKYSANYEGNECLCLIHITSKTCYNRSKYIQWGKVLLFN